MELKLINIESMAAAAKLLIEPYGIETVMTFSTKEGNIILLIEPYGIETCHKLL